MAVTHFPVPGNAKIKSCSRLCVLPDYQGIGIGSRFLDLVAETYKARGNDFKITTSAKNLIHAMRKNPAWMMTRYSANPPISISKKRLKSFTCTVRTQCKTATFFRKSAAK